MKVVVTRLAERDLLDGFAFYERQSEEVGAYFLDSLFSDIDSLVLYGGIHAKPDGRFHRCLAKRFPFAIYYQLGGDVVTVVAVLDCRQNPAKADRMLSRRK